MTLAITFLTGLLVGLAAPLAVLLRRRNESVRRDPMSIAERATYETLHTASRAAPLLRAGLTPGTAGKAVRHLRELLGTPALTIGDESGVLAWDGVGSNHREVATRLIAEVMTDGTTKVRELACPCDKACPVRHAIAAPLVVEGRIVGVLTALAPAGPQRLVCAVDEVAAWTSGQLELADLDQSKARLIEAEVRALRAQISPHFIYNSLTAIASFVRTDPDRARDLLGEFADFTRYSFRRHGEFTTLAEELRSIDQYLNLERARFGDRLTVSLMIAPEVLPVAVPFLCVQPLVENAVKHGMEDGAGRSHITITAQDLGCEALISVEDDGVGIDPDQVRRTLAGKPDSGSGIALGNIDERLRQVYGDDYGLVVETAVGAGTKVNLRVPKYRVGVHASA